MGLNFLLCSAIPPEKIKAYSTLTQGKGFQSLRVWRVHRLLWVDSSLVRGDLKFDISYSVNSLKRAIKGIM